MTPELYLGVARKLKNAGRRTDGCSLIGGLMDDKYEPACWAHDFARNGLMKDYIKDQAENDNLFRNTLRHLGMAPWKSNIIYFFTRAQGFMSQHVGMGLPAFLGFMFFLSVLGIIAYFELIK